MKAGFETMDDYIRSFPPGVRARLELMRRTIRKAAPGATEAISYQMPTFKLDGKNLVHFAAWKDHIGFYPTPSGTSAFAKELAAYPTAKGSVRFPMDEPLPLRLVARMVRFRAREHRQGKTSKEGRKR